MSDTPDIPSNAPVAVTGATGHIGNVLVRELLAQGRRVRAVVPSFEDGRSLEGLAVERVDGDLRDPDALKRAFSGVSIVFHLAGAISILPWPTKALHTVNVAGTRNVIQACLDCGVARMVYASSVHALLELPHGTTITETAGCDPAKIAGPYAQSKAQATLDVFDAVQRGLDAVVVYPAGVMGPYDFNKSEMGQLILDFAHRAIPAYVDGAYDFVDVRDVASGIIRAAERGRKGEGYILSGQILSVSAMLTMLQELTGVRAPALRIPMWTAIAAAAFNPLIRENPRFTTYSLRVLRSNCLFSNAKAQEELGYTARPLQESLSDAVDWFRAAGMIDS